MTTNETTGFPPGAFEKYDGTDDADFYAFPRFVTHIDDAAIAALSAFYRQALPAGGILLDLMSSWVSHLPADVAYAEVIGHGMNKEELAANPRLSRWFVRDLNRDPALPLDDASVDAAMICVSVQYLQRPVELLADLTRVLKPGGSVVISFSNRCFPTKAVAIWQGQGERGHARLVQYYLDEAGYADIETHVLADGRLSDPMIAVVGRKGGDGR